MKKLILLLTIAVVVTECGMHNRISSLRDNHVSAGLALPQETFIPSLKNRQEEKDTINPDSESVPTPRRTRGYSGGHGKSRFEPRGKNYSLFL